MPVFVWISVYICKFQGHAPVVFIGGKHRCVFESQSSPALRIFFFLLPRWHTHECYLPSFLLVFSIVVAGWFIATRTTVEYSAIFGAIFSSSPIGYLQKQVLPKVFIFVCFHWLLCWFAIHEAQLVGEIDSFFPFLIGNNIFFCAN